jgi:hypothetical protein
VRQAVARQAVIVRQEQEMVEHLISVIVRLCYTNAVAQLGHVELGHSQDASGLDHAATVVWGDDGTCIRLSRQADRQTLHSAPAMWR